MCSSPNTGKIGEYTTSGATVKADLITGLNGANGIAISGSDLFVSNSYDGEISEFTTSGATVNRALIKNSRTGDPADVAVSGSDLYVMNYTTVADTTNNVGEYTTSGATVNTDLISIPVADNLYRIAIGPATAAAPVIKAKVTVTLPASVKPGQKVTIKPAVTITNISDSAYDSSTTTRLFLSKSTHFNSSSIEIPAHLTKTIKLKAGAHVSYSLTITSIPSTLPAGTYYLQAVIKDDIGDSILAVSKVTISVT